MKKIRLLFTLILGLYVSLSFSQTDYLNFIPQVTNVSVNSGSTLQTTVVVQRFGNLQTNEIYSVSPAIIPDNGFLSVTPTSGFLFPNGSVILNFSFNRTVTSTATSFYRFFFLYRNQNYPIDIYVTYLASSCPTDLNIDVDVQSGQTDNQSAQYTITATNEVQSGATANYDAGTRVTLKPGFKAKAGSVFKAYIDGCTPSGNRGLFGRESENTKVTTVEVIDKEVDKKDINSLVKIYPNPVTSQFTIESSEKIISYSIFNRYGNQVIRKDINTKKWEVQVSELPRGFYYLELMTEKGKIVRKKIMKN